jgi:peptidoglycan-associated lipoprotein
MKKILSLLVVAVLLSGCAAMNKSAKKDGKKGKNAQADSEGGFTPDVNVSEVDIKDGATFGQAPELAPILFDYDSASLKGDALDTLKKNAAWLKANRTLDVLVAGHCDDRGTIEYNLALGQKRAREVREYYIRLGVNGKQVATISYGKESQVCADATEDCWAKNRRAETRVRARVAKQQQKKK